ncbi:hypothetical protein DPMN_182547 [Dreissena polymorpha]|uniref:Uncharacterized protein n=1 Tax=Dreissena polymorpha TaxID=45954 RepID=A0A9D4DGH0_DREPO|nr:hypothetical protein DPMN_182547 [Dreissena polymorpha]
MGRSGHFHPFAIGDLCTSAWGRRGPFLSQIPWLTTTDIPTLKLLIWIYIPGLKVLRNAASYSYEHYSEKSFAPSALASLRHLEPDHFEKSDDGPVTSLLKKRKMWTQ